MDKVLIAFVIIGLLNLTYKVIKNHFIYYIDENCTNKKVSKSKLELFDLKEITLEYLNFDYFLYSEVRGYKYLNLDELICNFNDFKTDDIFKVYRVKKELVFDNSPNNLKRAA